MQSFFYFLMDLVAVSAVVIALVVICGGFAAGLNDE